jgi:hypothetical protein
MTQPIDQLFHINPAFDASFAAYEDGTPVSSTDALEPDREYRAVAARPTTHDGLISTEAGTRAVVWDLAIETDRGVLWVPDTMLDPPYSDI